MGASNALYYYTVAFKSNQDTGIGIYIYNI